MRTCCFVLLVVIAHPFFSQSPNIVLHKVWETEKQLRVPESVLYDRSTQMLYVSNIDGTPLEKDGAGFISQLSPEGKIIQLEWISGLNAPKGMAVHNGMLYVSDIDEVISIDIKKGSIVLRTPVEDSKFLNDIAVNAEGEVFVSDNTTGRIHKIINGKVALFTEGLEGVNGLWFEGPDLYAVAKGNLWQVKSSSERTKLAQGMEESSDGLVMTADKIWLVTSWSGVVYQVSAKGKVQQLMDTRPQHLNTADLGIDPVKRQVFIPTFFGNTVVAYSY